MIVQLYLNTDGYLGAWGNVVTNPQLAFEIPNQDLPLFHGAIDGRDCVEILPINALKYDAQIGELKLKFHQDQSDKLVRLTKQAHKFDKTKNQIEQAIF